LREIGLMVTVVMPASVPLAHVLGREVGEIYRDIHAEHGVRLVGDQRVAAIRGDGAVEAVEMADGTRVEADLVVVGIGARPRTQLALNAGLHVDDGIVVDERLETSAPGIFAAGDVAAAWHPLLKARIRVEHSDNAKRQGRTAARNMLGMAEPYARMPFFYSDQYDLGMEYRGFAPTWDRVVLRGDPRTRRFLAFWLANGRVVAAMNANVWDVGEELQRLVESPQPVDLKRLTDPSVPVAEVAANPPQDRVIPAAPSHRAR
jgi:3-phenylpropionate/trans-cinnamate dioxygenase ferredoxin reductase subunit